MYNTYLINLSRICLNLPLQHTKAWILHKNMRKNMNQYWKIFKKHYIIKTATKIVFSIQCRQTILQKGFPILLSVHFNIYGMVSCVRFYWFQLFPLFMSCHLMVLQVIAILGNIYLFLKLVYTLSFVYLYSFSSVEGSLVRDNCAFLFRVE